MIVAMAKRIGVAGIVLAISCAATTPSPSGDGGGIRQDRSDVAVFRAVVDFLPTMTVEGLELRVDPRPLRSLARGNADEDFADVADSMIEARRTALQDAGVAVVSLSNRDTCSGRNGMPPAPPPPGVAPDPKQGQTAGQPKQGPFECAAVGLTRPDTAAGAGAALVRVYLVAPGRWTLADIEVTIGGAARATVSGKRIIHMIAS